eukprot:TRINITY_DN3697_c1_g1_i1.p1 TRINITY_DN3697_c1_g1~~TRINITY_DN3697_c1_g1_i1.p1  ORF type:complete len:542 (-),score=213.78 TRINITY_DN3697_c1_g1_i1:19-1644(-)
MLCHRLIRCTTNSSARALAHTWRQKPTLTKIVATIGPVSEDAETLQEVVSSGMRVMRINFSHATYEEANLRVTNLRKCIGVNREGLHHNYNLRAVMLDTQGPEIRTGLLAGGVKTVELKKGSMITLTTDPAHREKGTADRLWVNWPGLPRAVHKDSRVLLDDGLIECIVKKVLPNAIECEIANSGELKPRRGVNLPGALVDLPALSDKDKRDLEWGIKNDVDFVAASFVRKAQDLHDIRSFIRKEHARVWPADHPMPKIISKVENTEAIDNFEDILALSDAIMVARGDLGVEIPMEQVTNMQKWMVQLCNKAGKPVVVATQMLESMQNNPRPTRAEVSDVTNAVYDGADAVMLSGESAQGRYPVEAVTMMRRIISEAEEWRRSKLPFAAHTLREGPADSVPPAAVSADDDDEAACPRPYAEGVASAAVHAAAVLHARIILVLTDSGDLAKLVAKHRPDVPVICACPSHKVARQLMLSRGLHPMVVPRVEGEGADKVAAARAIDDATALGFCHAGDTIVIVAKEKQPGHLSEARSMRVCKVV